MQLVQRYKAFNVLNHFQFNTLIGGGGDKNASLVEQNKTKQFCYILLPDSVATKPGISRRKPGWGKPGAWSAYALGHEVQSMCWFSTAIQQKTARVMA